MFDVYYKNENQFEKVLGGANVGGSVYFERRKEPKKVYNVVCDSENNPLFLIFENDTWKFVSASEFVPPQ